ncbi:bifunctional diguanylate cyclase/phosphodiesterase [Desulfuromonas acetoxidans]|uniref:Diguanylate cyclase/phosphodiesterase with PAS/PAC sensor(S) n=1 Tax=Desulfuromonas acetoxidans (strain DSM 684 / 11070) TaxID=281689 RepID=Q1K260_DESA6|nr:EAL domain-containing protein [Desulfuromonas acetoxidans]EAT16579.1 diguanylate cyclase/phosphodiesterase with PAS/PAC sensor(s) [Desulfuromonas acetoxidans DSM 684]MBF0644456.1 EAL domain-containing protein [Desulfuromonas acetoxidans]NVD24690.1 EAL domain-containing protein [Desulfuromonas acetoxidans]NVE16735.1 EAL domain-containing protein [Desulfuromonas acetoxidans]
MSIPTIPTSANPAGLPVSLQGRLERTHLITRVRWQLISAIVVFCLVAEIMLVWSQSTFDLSILQYALLLGTLSTLNLYNLIYHYYYLKIARFAFIDHLHILLDIFVVTVLIHFTGGGNSWLWPLYLVTTIEAAFLLENRRDVLGIGALNGLFYAWALIAGHYNLLPYIYQPLDGTPALSETFLLLLWLWVTLLNTAIAFICTFLTHALRRKTAEASTLARRLGNFLNHANDLIIQFRPDGTIDYANQASRSILNIDPDSNEINISSLIDPTDRPRWQRQVLLLENGTSFPATELLMRTNSDQQAIILDSNVTLLEENDGQWTLWGIFRDITARRQAEARLDQLTNFDQLTGLAHRSNFMERAEQVTLMAKRERKNTAFLIINIDRFKLINDALGSAIGDEVLKAVSQRLLNQVREVDVVGRLNGDEFVIMLVNVESADIVHNLAVKITQALTPMIAINSHELFLTTSTGIALYPQDGDTPEELLKQAEIALLSVKSTGRNGIQFFTDQIDLNQNSRLRLLNGLHLALQQQQFVLHYQPKVNIHTGQITSVEALIRWNHPEMGWVMPTEFIPLAEESGLIGIIGRWVLEEACRQCLIWQQQGLPPIRMAVNFSGHQLQQESLLKSITDVLKKTGLAAQWLEVEITETVIMQNPEVTINILQAIQKLGVHIAIDDFGTGYSSLAYLKRFPVNTLKIDRAFVRDIEQSDTDAAIVGAILKMGATLKLNIVAEGVETHGQRKFLEQHNCHEIQGFLYSPAVPPERIVEMVRQGENGTG